MEPSLPTSSLVDSEWVASRKCFYVCSVVVVVLCVWLFLSFVFFVCLSVCVFIICSSVVWLVDFDVCVCVYSCLACFLVLCWFCFVVRLFCGVWLAGPLPLIHMVACWIQQQACDVQLFFLSVAQSESIRSVVLVFRLGRPSFLRPPKR